MTREHLHSLATNMWALGADDATARSWWRAAVVA